MSVDFLRKLNGNNKGHFNKFLKVYKKNIKEPKISWYCSGGDDFRNLIFLSKEYVNENVNEYAKNEWIEPDLYIYTDYYTPFFEKLFPEKTIAHYIKPLSFLESYITEMDTLGSWCLYDDDRTRIRVKKFEILPCLNAMVDSELVEFIDFDSTKKKVVFIVLDVWSKKYGHLGEKSLLYLNVENEWFANELVKSNAIVTHITHVRYGTNFGFAKAKGAYLKNILGKLKTKFFISDPHLEPNVFDRIATRLYPTLKNNINQLIRLKGFHTVPSKSWSCHGDVSFYYVINTNKK